MNELKELLQFAVELARGAGDITLQYFRKKAETSTKSDGSYVTIADRQGKCSERTADKAGLIGGDVILKIDGQPIQSEDQMDDLLEKTPIGKTINIEYLRDGEKKTAQLTTISQEDHRKLSREFERRPEGRAQFGYEDGDAERVAVPRTNIHGVRLDTILRSRPADIAGVKDGDIVIEFDGVPIRTSDEFLMRVRRSLPYSTVNVVVMRGEGDVKEKIEIPVKMGKQ